MADDPAPPHARLTRRRRTSVAPTMLADGAIPSRPVRHTIVDSAVYVDGDRVASPESLLDTYRELHAQSGAMAWIGLYRPDQHDLTSLAAEFDLHELAVEDAILAHQRPKLERYDDTLFVVLRAARYLDDLEEVEFGEVHLFVGADFVVTLRHSEAPDLAAVRHRLESTPHLLRLGPEAVLYAIMDRVVDGYLPVVAGLSNDIDEIETEVFRGDPQVSRRIYQLTREVIEFQRAAEPLAPMFTALTAGFEKYGTDEELRRYLRDVEDHIIAVVEQLESFRQLLRDMLTVNATLVAQEQNEEMRRLSVAGHAQNEEVKRISAWAAILFAPTVVGGIYGMNFDSMPELHWAAGYPFALVLMLAVSVGLFLAFKHRGWL
jgi:magnesium transporter